MIFSFPALLLFALVLKVEGQKTVNVLVGPSAAAVSCSKNIIVNFLF